jgi:hypothetical protein
VSRNLEAIAFDPLRFEKELKAFARLLKSKDELSEAGDIQPFFERNKHLSAYLGTFSPNIGPATELAFKYPFFGDFAADLVLGNKDAGEFCVVEFEPAGEHSIFKKQPKRGHPEWSSRFEHGFSQLADWFYNLDDFKGTKGFSKTFGAGHVTFIGMLVIGRSSGLDAAKRNRLKWRTEKVLIDSHPVWCITFDDLYTQLRDRYARYKNASRLEKAKRR